MKNVASEAVRKWVGSAVAEMLAWEGVEKVIASFEDSGDVRITLRQDATYMSQIFVLARIEDRVNIPRGSFVNADIDSFHQKWAARKDFTKWTTDSNWIRGN